MSASAFQDGSDLHPVQVKRAQSCDIDVSLNTSQQPRDNHGYLEPVSAPRGRPRYLELFGENSGGQDGAVGGSSTDKPPSNLSLPQWAKHLTASAPSLASRLLRASPVRSIHSSPARHPKSANNPISYAQLDAESLESNLDKWSHSPEESVEYTPMMGLATQSDKLSKNADGNATFNPRNDTKCFNNTHRETRSGSREPFLMSPMGALSPLTESPKSSVEFEPASDSEQERLLKGEHKRHSSSFLRDLSPFTDRRNGGASFSREAGHRGDRHSLNDADHYSEPYIPSLSEDGYMTPLEHRDLASKPPVPYSYDRAKKSKGFRSYHL